MGGWVIRRINARSLSSPWGVRGNGNTHTHPARLASIFLGGFFVFTPKKIINRWLSGVVQEMSLVHDRTQKRYSVP